MIIILFVIRSQGGPAACDKVNPIHKETLRRTVGLISPVEKAKNNPQEPPLNQFIWPRIS
jgi:hypothetical protein